MLLFPKENHTFCVRRMSRSRASPGLSGFAFWGLSGASLGPLRGISGSRRFFGASWGAFCLVLLWVFSWTSPRLLWCPFRGLSGACLGRSGVLSEAFAANCFMISLNPFGGLPGASLGCSGELSKAFSATRFVVSLHFCGVSLELF